jgi:hypothetical protein
MRQTRIKRIVVTSFSHSWSGKKWVDRADWQIQHYLGNPWLGVQGKSNCNFRVVKTRGGLDRELNRLPTEGDHMIELVYQTKGGGDEFPGVFANRYASVGNTGSWERVKA